MYLPIAVVILAVRLLLGDATTLDNTTAVILDIVALVLAVLVLAAPYGARFVPPR